MSRIETFMNFEEENHMFERELLGVKYWQLLRYEIFVDIINHDLNIIHRHPDLEKNKQPSFYNAMCLAFNALKYRNHWDIAKHKVLFSATCKKRNDFVEVLISSFKDDIFYLNRPFNFQHLLTKNDYNCSAIPDGIELLRGIAITVFSHISILKKLIKKDIITWAAIFNETFNTQLDLDKTCSRIIYDIFSIIILHRYFKYKLKVAQPKLVIVTPFYEMFNFALILASKELNIKVIELQHGYISKNHIAYNFKRLHEDYLPDKFIFFGDYWKDIITFPKKDRIYVCGSIELEHRLLEYKNIIFEKLNDFNDSSILIISQGPYADKLYPFAVELANLFQMLNVKKKIIYKLHPSEVNTWNELHPTYNDNRIDLNSGNIYDLMKDANIQIGIDSTAIFEGFAFGLKTFIIDCMYLKNSNMKELCNAGYATLITAPSDILKYLDLPIQFKDVEYFWHSNALKNICNVIKTECQG